jgi:long-chain acyl-CoA synthetase
MDSFTCGDVGYFDNDGYLYLCDRRREMVISGGVNTYPAEIEAVLIGIPGVLDCAVIGIPDDEFGKSLPALVQPDPASADGSALTEVRIIDLLREHLAGYKVPRRIEFRSGLPRDDSGKIYKRHLREPYWQGRERRI